MSTDLTQHYKALALERRMELALAGELAEELRPLLLQDQWMHVKCYFARRLDLRPHEVAALLDDQDHVIRLCIAKRPDLTPDQIARCVADRDPNVRYFIARHPGLTAAQRECLRQDMDPLVRKAAGKAPRVPQIRQRPGQAALIK